MLYIRHNLPKTLDDTIRRAIEWETVEQDVHSTKDNSVNSLQQAHELDSATGSGTCSMLARQPEKTTTDEVLVMMKEMLSMMKEDRESRRQENTRQKNTNRNRGYGSNVKCFNCNRYGHVSRDCQQRKRDDNCWNCGKPGHTRSQCRSLKNDSENSV